MWSVAEYQYYFSLQDFKTGRSRGFGIVRMKTQEAFDTILKEQYHQIDGYEVFYLCDCLGQVVTPDILLVKFLFSFRHL